MNLPDYIMIGGKKVQIIIKDMDLIGQYISDQDGARIFLKKDQPNLLDALFHELVHACLDISGVGYLFDEGQEEAIVRCLENILLPALINLNENCK